MPGDYKIIWRTMKITRRDVGLANSAVMASLSTRKVHPSETCLGKRENTDTCHVQLDMNQLNSMVVGRWFDVPLGSMRIDDFTDVSSRMWCHSGEWKHGLAWDSVRLKDLNEPEQVQHEVQPSVAQAVNPLMQTGRMAVEGVCSLQ